MLRKLFGHMRQNIVAWLALFVALGGTSAWATHETILSSDIVNNEVYTADVRDDTLSFGGLFHQDLAANSVRSSEIATGAVTSSEIATGAVTSSEIADSSVSHLDIRPDAVDDSHIFDGSLKDGDIAQFGGILVNFLGDIGNVPARSCVERLLSGIDAQGDHLLLAANSDGSDPQLSYTVEYSTSSANAFIKVCNPTNSDINDSFTRFNLLEINAN